MQYIQPFMFFAYKPAKGLTNLLMGTVCILIPIIGGIILLGYRVEVADDLERDPELEEYPDFQFDRFVMYLQRGTWPFITQVLMSVLMVFPLSILAFGVGFVVHEYGMNNMVVALAGGMASWVIGLIGMQAILWPIVYHAEMPQSKRCIHSYAARGEGKNF